MKNSFTCLQNKFNSVYHTKNLNYFHKNLIFSELNFSSLPLGYARKNSTRSSATKPKTGKYADSLNLPQMPYSLSDFKPDGRCNNRERYIHQITDFSGLYEWQQKNNTGPAFTIHDGPPYANGSPHVGHALNKIIKDVINRYRVLRGHKVDFVPGWDCHGLPIETKAKACKDGLSDLEIRIEANRFSRATVELQKKEFKEWGVMADWENPYITSNPSFVQNELDVFQRLYDKALIYQDYMPVYWSPSSKTALAEAELEYNTEHKSQSIYVRLPLTSLPDQLKSHVRSNETVNLVIWTTTPWTLPANQAVCYSPKLEYCLVRPARTSNLLIIAQELLQTVTGKLSAPFDVLSTFPSEVLSGLFYHHPIYRSRVCPLLPADHVVSDMGTGLVHTAPAHGHDDFKVALRHGLSKESLVDGNGNYTAEAGEEFAAKHIFDDGNRIVEGLLGDALLHSEEYVHKYPYDWRSKQPVLIRASRQWFIDTKKLIGPAIKALEEVDVFPSVYKSPLSESISQRPYWCISRQRAWGVPIPAFYDELGNAYVHRAITDNLRQLIMSRGPGIWWEGDDRTLLPDHIKAEAGIASDLKLSRGRDILDIWFDSGVTWSAVLGNPPADLYIEGIDQIRGWFQSSLLTSVALNGHAPYKSIMMHGFTVDEEGQKMSKSLGNVVAPSDVIHGDKGKSKPGYGVDVLRWWAASKYSVTNVDIGPNMIRQCNDKMLQLRKRMRFILGNVYDFVPEKHLIDYDMLLPQDQYFLHLAHEYAQQVTKCYESNELSSVLKWLELFTAKFSHIYATQSKDRLYCFPANSQERRSAQTILHHTFDVLVYSMAPILPYFSEDCYVHRYGNQLNKGLSPGVSIFRSAWVTANNRWQNDQLAAELAVVFEIVEEIRCLLNGKLLDMMDVILATENEENESLRILKGLQRDAEYGELHSHSPLCETIQCAGVGLVTADSGTESPVMTECEHVGIMPELGIKIYLKETERTRCQRCRRYTASSASEPCEMCLLNMAHTWAT